jgi:hypothetical protein
VRPPRWETGFGSETATTVAGTCVWTEREGAKCQRHGRRSTEWQGATCTEASGPRGSGRPPRCEIYTTRSKHPCVANRTRNSPGALTARDESPTERATRNPPGTGKRAAAMGGHEARVGVRHARRSAHAPLGQMHRTHRTHRTGGCTARGARTASTARTARADAPHGRTWSTRQSRRATRMARTDATQSQRTVL